MVSALAVGQPDGQQMAPASDSVQHADTASGAQPKEDAGAVHQRIVRLGGAASYAGAGYRDCPDGCPSSDSILRSYRNASWYEIDAHPFLDSLFPGVRLVKVALGAHGESDYFVVFKDGYTRGLNDLNTILEDRGFSFDSSEMNTIAKIAVLFMYVQRPPVVRPLTREMEMQQLLEGDYASASSPRYRALPFVAFKSFKRELVTEAGIVRGGKVIVECEIDGIERTVGVAFHGRTRFIPDGIWTQDGVIQYMPWRMPTKDPGE